MYVEFCLPAYNEEKILKDSVIKVLEFCRKQNWPFDWKMYILVNGSIDKTEEIAKELSRSNHEVSFRVLGQSGKGYALSQHWKSSQADVLVCMDVDLAVSLEDLPKLINSIIENGNDLAIGSRLLPGSETDRSLVRELSSQTYNLLSRLILGHRFSDLQCGFKCITKKAFDQVSAYTQNNFWFFDTELIIFANFFKMKIEEIPVEWQENRYEKRKTKVKLLKDSLDFIYRLFRLRLKLNRIKQINKHLDSA